MRQSIWKTESTFPFHGENEEKRSVYAETENPAKASGNLFRKLLKRYRESLRWRPSDLAFKLDELQDHLPSATSARDRKRSYPRRIIEILDSVLRNSSRRQLQDQGPNVVVYSIIRVILYYEEDTCSTSRESLCSWRRKRQRRLAWELYEDVLRSFVPEMSRELVEVVTNVIQRNQLWHLEGLCFQLLQTMLECGVKSTTISHAVLNKIESPRTDMDAARVIVRILYELLEKVEVWPDSAETLLFVNRLLSLFVGSVTVPKVYPLLRKGFEVCLRRTIARLNNDHLLLVIRRMCEYCIQESNHDEAVLNFGSALEFAAFTHNTLLLKDTLTDEILPLITRMIGSESRLVNLLGNRVLQYLIDRNDNRAIFDSPLIFFQSMDFDVVVGVYNREDKLFLRTHREELHESFMKGVVMHCETRLNLENFYCTVCLIAVEIPCGFTAAALVCFLMNLQNITLEHQQQQQQEQEEEEEQQKTRDREVSYHIHATIASLMTLICWVHKARVFYEYVEKIVIRRAQWAPHLNPPLQSKYRFAVHHVRWDKPELFFVDWDTRYGLWKCFRTCGISK